MFVFPAITAVVQALRAADQARDLAAAAYAQANADRVLFGLLATRPIVRRDQYPLIPPRSPTWWDAYKPLVVPLAYSGGIVAMGWMLIWAGTHLP